MTMTCQSITTAKHNKNMAKKSVPEGMEPYDVTQKTAAIDSKLSPSLRHKCGKRLGNCGKTDPRGARGRPDGLMVMGTVQCETRPLMVKHGKTMRFFGFNLVEPGWTWFDSPWEQATTTSHWNPRPGYWIVFEAQDLYQAGLHLLFAHAPWYCTRQINTRW